MATAGWDDDGGEEAVNTTVQAEAWAGDSSGSCGSVDGGGRRTDQQGDRAGQRA